MLIAEAKIKYKTGTIIIIIIMFHFKLLAVQIKTRSGSSSLSVLAFGSLLANMSMANVRKLSPALQENACKDLNEIPENVASDIEALKSWIQHQAHLKARTDDQFLLAFLRGCKFSLEKTKTKIDRYYTLRSKLPEIYGPVEADLNRCIELVKTGSIFYLPNALHETGPRIGMMRFAAYSTDKFNIPDMVKTFILMQDILLLDDDEACVNGVVQLFDFEGCKASHYLQMNPSTLMKIATWLQQAIPLRPQQFQYFNSSSAFEQIFAIFKPMLPKKIQERLYLHGSNLDELHKHVPQKYFPKEYGGENGSIQESIEEWVRRIESYREYFREESHYGTNEKLRVGKPIDLNGILGIEGSFRRLDVD